MPTLEGIEFLTTTVETGSFAAAARRLRVTPSAVSRRVARLEHELGVPLLTRTTRSLHLTHDGEAFYQRCVRILQELTEARDAIARTSGRPSGLLRVDAPTSLGRVVLTPSLPRFFARYPEVRVGLSLRDQFIDPAAEGIDVLVRLGALGDSNLIARRLGATRVVYCASPDYLRRRGAPKSPRDLARHDCLGYLSEGRPSPYTFATPDGIHAVEIAGPCHVNDADALRELALAGLGVVGIFDFHVRDALASGALVAVLEGHPTPARPIHALYPKNRHLLPKVAVFLEHLTELFRPADAPPERRATAQPRARPPRR